MDKIAIPVSCRQIMFDQAIRCMPEEGCGLLGGRGEQVEAALPITNQLHSPNKFYMDPVELVESFHWLDDHGLEILGIFHSHPKGPDHPSETDLQEYLYPTAAALILYYSGMNWQIKAYLIDAKIASEIPITWLESA